MNGYEGVETDPAAFTIEPKNAESDSQIKVPDITADTDLDHLEIKDGDKVLVQGTDYDVTKTQDGNEVTVTITYKGNYTGVTTKTYTLDENKPDANKPDNNKPDDHAKKPSQGSKDTKKTAKLSDSSVKTGDTARTGLWGSALALSAGILALFTKKRKHEKNNSEDV